jgi:hypothetical protein
MFASLRVCMLSLVYQRPRVGVGILAVSVWGRSNKRRSKRKGIENRKKKGKKKKAIISAVLVEVDQQRAGMKAMAWGYKSC